MILSLSQNKTIVFGSNFVFLWKLLLFVFKLTNIKSLHNLVTYLAKLNFAFGMFLKYSNLVFYHGNFSLSLLISFIQ